MAVKSSLARRIKLTVLIVFVVAIVLGVGEVLRRYFEREEVAAIYRVLNEAQTSNAPLAEIDPQWEELSRSLRSRLEDAPGGPLAVLSYRAVMRMSDNLHGSISLADRPTFTVRYGDLVERDVPVPDQAQLWTIQIQGSWDSSPWFAWYRGTWAGEGKSVHEIALNTGLPDERRNQASALLKLRALLKLYVGEKAVAAGEASGPEELARVPFVYQERKKLGSFKVWIHGVQAESERP